MLRSRPPLSPPSDPAHSLLCPSLVWVSLLSPLCSIPPLSCPLEAWHAATHLSELRLGERARGRSRRGRHFSPSSCPLTAAHTGAQSGRKGRKKLLDEEGRGGKRERARERPGQARSLWEGQRQRAFERIRRGSKERKREGLENKCRRLSSSSPSSLWSNQAHRLS